MKFLNIHRSPMLHGIATLTAIALFTPTTVSAQISLPRNVVTYIDSEYTISNGTNDISDSLDDSEFSDTGYLSASLDGAMNQLVDTSTVQSVFNLDAASGKITSSMDVDLSLIGYNGSDYGWGEYTLEGNTEAFIQDVININDNSFGFMEISIGYDGSMLHELRLDSQDESSAGIETHSNLRTFLSWEPDAVADLFFTDGDQVSSSDTLNEEIAGFDPKSKTNSLTVDSLSQPAIIPLLGDPASFTLSIGWDELARTRIYNVDALWAESSISHDFMSTANLQLNFYDENMNPMAAPSYTSSQGINYQFSAVPEPSSLVVLNLLTSVLILRRRRQIQALFDN
ncbi:PEP-CTERM sorting domain-containing protein [Mariniblastus fucicola]|uniref:PEP-CTERM protein-sorting domain-containing protein n=1 Tax=Mariniblastus fucicola TaxID=980251 RepID=A0A5B9P6C3_9BACT|nr:PEP-CTERM sorting domain-containing protein [Mariniblastus fucicola]QEG22137.1 hypothetical protein MFFC18_19980 [Mariniblastus fucicola]